MDRDEVVLLAAFMRAAASYLEFGCGGSTWLATQTVRRSVTSVDSHQGWIKETSEKCAKIARGFNPRFEYADIGDTVALGYPRGYPTIVDSKPEWAAYHSTVWDNPEAASADLFLVDGRFRVACALQILLRCRMESFLAVHDYSDRDFYHAIDYFARRVAIANRLFVFQKTPDFDPDRAVETLGKYRTDPR